VQDEKASSRSTGLGGSDIAALLGISPYKTPLELWAEKVGHPSVKTKEGLHLRYGQHLEPFVAKEFEKTTGLATVEHAEKLIHPEHSFFYAHIDRFIVNQAWEPAVIDGAVVANSLLECKTASVYSKDEWGAEGTDQVPNAYLLQCIWYMAITGCSTAHIAVLIGNSDFRTYMITRDEKLERLVIDQAKKFWFDHVLEGIPPQPKNVQDLKLLFPQEKVGQSFEATPQMIESLAQLRQMQEEAKRLEARSEEVKTQIMNMMGEAELISHCGQALATWKSTKPTQRIDTIALKKSFPDLAAQFTVTGQPQRRFLMKEHHENNN